MFYKKWFDETKPVLVAGDSYTYGMGHQNTELDPFRNPPAPTTWPNYIWPANEFNKISNPGISNGDITQSIYEHWNNNIKVVAVMFSLPNRRDYSYKDYGYSFSPNNIVSLSNNPLENQMRHTVVQNNKELFDQFHKMYFMQESDVSNHINQLKNVIAIQNLCNSTGCKFFWCTVKPFSMGQERSENPYVNWQIWQLEKLIDITNYFSIDNKSMQEFGASFTHNVTTSTGHYTKEVHEIWGQAFSRFINNCI